MVVDSSQEISKPALTGWVFDIQRYSINDGPGIRTTVFFKGCPLSCVWCDNPESQYQLPQMLFFESLCVQCYRCVSVCSTGATSIDPEGAIKIDRKKCTACGACAKACLAEARNISGRCMTIDEVLEIVKKDSLFYRNSGGGVTASGGEATAQPKFIKELFRRCQESGIHTTLDTCGYVKWQDLEEILQFTDLVLFDIKHMDPLRHMELAGTDNVLILQNAERIVQLPKPIKMRMPLIPGCNDSEDNIRATCKFVSGLGINEIDILPYHQLGASKYERLGMVYQLSEITSYTEEQVETIKKMLESLGLQVSIA